MKATRKKSTKLLCKSYMDYMFSQFASMIMFQNPISVIITVVIIKRLPFLTYRNNFTKKDKTKISQKIAQMYFLVQL